MNQMHNAISIFINKPNWLNKLFGLLYKLLLSSMVLYLLIIPFMPNLSGLLRLPTIFIAFSIFFLYLCYCSYDRFELIAYVLILFIIGLNFLLFPNTWESEAIYRTCGFLALLSLLLTSRALRLDSKLLSFTYIVCIITTLIFLVYSFLPFAHWDTKRYVPSLTLGFSNPNTTGMLLFFTYSLIVICKPKTYKWFSWICQLILLYLIFQTDSRTAFISSLLVSTPFISARKRPYSIWFLFLAYAIPFLFIKIYLDMYYYLGTDITFLDKPLFSGREEVFVRSLDAIDEPLHYIIGHAETGIFGNAHNAPLAVFCSIGLVGVLLYFGMLLRKIFICNSCISNKTSATAVFVLLICMIYSSTEAAIFLGGFPLLIFLYILFVLAHYQAIE